MSAGGRWIDRALGLGAIVMLAVLLLTVTAGVVSRGLGEPFIWTDEAARFLMVWIAAIGWMLASRRRAHIRIRFFQDRLPLGARRGAEIAMQAAIVVLGLAMARFGLVLVERNWDIEATMIPLSMSLIYLPIVLVGALTAGQAALDLASQVRRPGPAAGPSA